MKSVGCKKCELVDPSYFKYVLTAVVPAKMEANASVYYSVRDVDESLAAPATACSAEPSPESRE